MATDNGNTTSKPTNEAPDWRNSNPLDPSVIVTNAIMSRAALMARFTDPRRNIDQECGYPDTSSLTPLMFQELYDRHPIAARVVECLPSESWKIQPSIYETEDSDLTEFEEAWQNLPRQLMGDDNYHQDQLGSVIWGELLQADIASGIGQYGITLVGTDDGRLLNEPAESKAGRKLLYLRTFPEYLAQIASFDTDPKSPRFGQPLEYIVWFNDPREGTANSAMGLPMTSATVHWSRVIHYADNTMSNKVFGAQRMRPVINPLLDLRKLYGGSAEMYWQGALPGMSIESIPQLGADVRINEKQMRDMMEAYRNGLQREIFLKGLHAEMLAPQVVDPTNQINVHLDAICVRLAIPKRIFLGSERGDLASSQDQDAWNERLKFRQQFYLSPFVIRPFINRLIALGCLPKPKGYTIYWPDLSAVSAQELAEVASTTATAIATYVNSGSQVLVPPRQFMVEILKWDEAKAEAVLEASRAQLDAEEPETGSPLLRLVGGIQQILAMFAAFKNGQLGEETLKQLIMLFYGVDEDRAEAIIAEGLPEPPSPELPPVPPGLRGARAAATSGLSGQGGNGLQGSTLPNFSSTPNTGGTSTSGTPQRVGSIGNQANNAFCGTGPGGGVDPTCSPGTGGGEAVSTQPTPGRKGLVAQGIETAKAITAKVSAVMDKVTDAIPGARLVKKASAFASGLTKGMYKRLETRYGKAAAIAIMASGQAVGWGATVGGLVTTGVPVVLPGSSLWGALPAAAMAETLLQVAKAGRKVAGVIRSAAKARVAMNAAELTDEDIQRLGRQVWEELLAAFQQFTEDHEDEVAEVA